MSHRSPPVAPAARAGRSPAPAARAGFDLEDLLGGRVLAWAGGVAVVAGIAFFLAIAVSRGWIGPGARTLLAGLLSVGLVGAGSRLYERGGRTDAALASLAAGIAGLFMTVVVGGPVYDVLPAPVALTLALATGALATAFAVRWQAPGIGALGIVGGLLSPVLAGAPSTGTTLAILWIAAASAAAVLVWQRWNWLAIAVFAITVPQWIGWIGVTEPPTPQILLVLCAFGALNVAAAIGFELRVPATRLRVSSALLLTSNAAMLAVAGAFALDHFGALTLSPCVGRRPRRGASRRRLRDALDADQPRHPAAVARARRRARGRRGRARARRTGARRDVGGDDGRLRPARAPRARSDSTTSTRGRDATLLGLGLGGHLLLTTMQALTQAPPDALAANQSIAFGGYAAIAATACAAFVAGRFVDDVRREWRVALDIVAMAGVAYLTAVALDGALLAAAYAAEAVALATIALRERDDVAGWGAGAHLGLALGYTLTVVATPDALVTGLDDLPGAALALGAGAAAALWGAHLADRARRGLDPDGELADILTRARATARRAPARSPCCTSRRRRS